MAIRNVVTRGYSAGATIPFVVTRGYTIGVAVVIVAKLVVRFMADDRERRIMAGPRNRRFLAEERRRRFNVNKLN